MLLIKIFSENLKSSFIFSLFILIAFAFNILLASPLLVKTLALSTRIFNKLFSRSLIFIFVVETPSKTDKKVSSSKDFKSFSVELPKRILDAFLAISSSSLLWTLFVISSAIDFWSSLKCGLSSCFAISSTIWSLEYKVKI